MTFSERAVEAAKKAAPKFWRQTSDFDKHMAKCLTAALAVDGLPVEIREQNDAIDEIVADRCNLHIEQMTDDSWFVGIEASDGSYSQFWIGARNRKSPVDVRHTETISAAEYAAPPLTAASDGEVG